MREKVNQTVMHSYPGMVALVTVTADGQSNVMAAGWHTYISYEPPMYGVAIGRERHSYPLLKEAGTFAINFLPFEKVEEIQKSGILTGARVDKLKNLPYEAGEETGAPILKDAYVAYECKTVDIQTYGDHDLFVARLVGFYRDQEKFLDSGLPNLEKLNIPLYLGRSTYVKLDQSVEHKDCLE
ncbi:flavin reductase family protein [Bacillus sp. FJAT-45037]|uniref:flavin reductase family protein n=1 Tax=Bacillus sp. FJAT-45037 TaxID=2011007 RepID=UPI000C237050|nr:flavin reductase family protein [Bacillus sp. FJAT-45037]